MLDLEEAVESLSASEITLLNVLQDMEVGDRPDCVHTRAAALGDSSSRSLC